MDDFASYRRKSRGWTKDPIANIHPKISIGPGFLLTEEFVKKYDIGYVINCADPNDSPEWFRKQFPDKYVCIGAKDTLDSNIIDWYPMFEEAMNTGLSSKDCIRVYIHCQCGINRSIFLSILYVCKKLQYTYNSLVKAIMYQRPCAMTNYAYRKQVEEHILRNHPTQW